MGVRMNGARQDIRKIKRMMIEQIPSNHPNLIKLTEIIANSSIHELMDMLMESYNYNLTCDARFLQTMSK